MFQSIQVPTQTHVSVRVFIEKSNNTQIKNNDNIYIDSISEPKK